MTVRQIDPKQLEKLGALGQKAYAGMRAGKPAGQILKEIKREILLNAVTEEERKYVGLVAAMEIALVGAAIEGDTETKFLQSEEKIGDTGFTKDTWEPARRAMQEERIFNNPKFNNPKAVSHTDPNDPPTCVIMMGLTGAGKSTAVKEKLAQFQKTAVVVNPDDIKEVLPGYKGWNAAVVHEESSRLGKELFYRSAADKKNMVLDVTGRSTTAMQRYVKLLKSQGYKVKVVMADVDMEDSVASSILRLAEGREALRAGDEMARLRYVPLEFTRTARVRTATGGWTTDVMQTFQKLKGQLDGYVVIDNREAMRARREAAKTGVRLTKIIKGKVIESKGSVFD